MFLTSVQPYPNRVLLDALLAALMTRPAGALLSTPTVHLYTAATANPNPNSAVANFTEATFAGYSSVAIAALLGPINLPSGNGRGVHAEADFVAGAIVTPGQTCLGYWIDDGAATLYLAEAFATPVTFANPGDFLSLDVIFGEITPTRVE